MGRPKGAKNKRTQAREATIAARTLAAAGGEDAPVVMYDCLAIMETAAQFFFDQFLRLKSKAQRPNGQLKFTKANYGKAREHLNDAVRVSSQVAPYRHPTYSTLKISGDKVNPLFGKSEEELRAEILEDLKVLDLLPEPVKVPALAAPKAQGVAPVPSVPRDKSGTKNGGGNGAGSH